MKKVVAFFKKLFGLGKSKNKPHSKFDYGKMIWAYGGFDGSKAKECARITGLKIDFKSRRMYYSWASGGCENLGATSHEDYKNTFACIFYWDEVLKAWVGGKFDEISTSRTWRPLNNCESGYRGWKWAPLACSNKHAFVIVGKDGLRRTNVVFS